MCVSLLIASAVVSTVGGFVQAGARSAAAEGEANWRNYQIEVQNRQLAAEKELVRIQAMQAETKRLEEQRITAARNEAFVAGSNILYNRAAFDIQKKSQENVRKDIAALRLNEATTVSRIADQIAVNRAEGQYMRDRAGLISDAAYVDAAFSGMSSMLSAGYKADYYKTRNLVPTNLVPYR